MDEIDPKMVRGLNLNLEEQALLAGTQCMGMSHHSCKNDRKYILLVTALQLNNKLFYTNYVLSALINKTHI